LPFFTTKDRGSGLGLAVAYSIVQNHNGAIEADSKPGLGTTFRVTLPLLVDRADSKKTMPISPSPAAARILVMDDEAIVRQVAARALGRTGFQVLTAINGTEAVAAYADAVAQGSRIDAVILDLTVRDGMGGKEAAMRIQALDPTARLIVSSGYSDDAIMSDYRSHGFCAVLPKPYSASQLCEMVSIALAGVTGERARQDG
jgi:CheY-like chemotaxis protein